MYKILKKRVCSVEGNEKDRYDIEILVDTEADLPTPETEWASGSFALIANTKKIKVLNNAGEWV